MTDRNELVALTEVEQRIEKATTIPELKTIRDQAETFRAWAKKARKGLQAQNKAALIKILAERKAGQIIAAVDRREGRPRKGNSITLREFYKRHELPSATGERWQILATVSEAYLREKEVKCNEAKCELTSASIYLERSRRRQEDANTEALRRQIDFEAAGIYLGDFRDRYADVIPAESVQLVLTDPPYDKDSLELFEAVAIAAKNVLRPGGSLLVYSGQKYLGEAIAALSKHLRYWWTFALVHAGSAQLLQKLGVRCQWKPIVWCVKGTRGDVSNIIPDVVTGSGREKDAHEWQQGEAEAADLIEWFTRPGEVVVDFCAGSGTVLAAAKNLDRRSVGFEVRADHVEKIAQRLGAHQ